MNKLEFLDGSQRLACHRRTAVFHVVFHIFFMRTDRARRSGKRWTAVSVGSQLNEQEHSAST